MSDPSAEWEEELVSQLITMVKLAEEKKIGFQALECEIRFKSLRSQRQPLSEKEFTRLFERLSQDRGAPTSEFFDFVEVLPLGIKNGNPCSLRKRRAEESDRVEYQVKVEHHSTFSNDLGLKFSAAEEYEVEKDDPAVFGAIAENTVVRKRHRRSWKFGEHTFVDMTEVEELHNATEGSRYFDVTPAQNRKVQFEVEIEFNPYLWKDEDFAASEAERAQQVQLIKFVWCTLRNSVEPYTLKRAFLAYQDANGLFPSDSESYTVGTGGNGGGLGRLMNLAGMVTPANLKWCDLEAEALRSLRFTVCPKLDGQRCFAVFQHGNVWLLSPNGSITCLLRIHDPKSETHSSLHKVLLDGEIVPLQDGETLASGMVKSMKMVFVPFDVLHVPGYLLRSKFPHEDANYDSCSSSTLYIGGKYQQGADASSANMAAHLDYGERVALFLKGGPLFERCSGHFAGGRILWGEKKFIKVDSAADLHHLPLEATCIVEICHSNVDLNDTLEVSCATDGLIFTPSKVPISGHCGSQQVPLKWKPQDKITVDLRLEKVVACTPDVQTFLPSIHNRSELLEKEVGPEEAFRPLALAAQPGWNLILAPIQVTGWECEWEGPGIYEIRVCDGTVIRSRSDRTYPNRIDVVLDDMEACENDIRFRSVATQDSVSGLTTLRGLKLDSQMGFYHQRVAQRLFEEVAEYSQTKGVNKIAVFGHPSWLSRNAEKLTASSPGWSLDREETGGQVASHLGTTMESHTVSQATGPSPSKSTTNGDIALRSSASMQCPQSKLPSCLIYTNEQEPGSRASSSRLDYGVILFSGYEDDVMNVMARVGPRTVAFAYFETTDAPIWFLAQICIASMKSRNLRQYKLEDEEWFSPYCKNAQAATCSHYGVCFHQTFH